MVYLKLKEQYLKNIMHPNHLELLQAGKNYFRDDSFFISDSGKEGSEENQVSPKFL